MRYIYKDNLNQIQIQLNEFTGMTLTALSKANGLKTKETRRETDSIVFEHTKLSIRQERFHPSLSDNHFRENH